MAREQFRNLTEPMYYILLALKEERHGYEIMQMIDEFTNGRVQVGPGTLYNLLSRFQSEGIIRLLSDDGRRKTYKLTKDGEQVLDEELRRLKKMVIDGENILNIPIKEQDTSKENIKIKIKKDDDLFY